ncbi:hypothetical protein V5E97_23260 [Singulisphaera sp. Ch08]|uniref:Uncharacterized protein n=1 Tax=Singulisphaera sp. Ch08 TaxID=3120278 RepID=A0AAU7C797_9BACT
MARVPFQGKLADLFASDKSVILKVLAGAFVGAFLFRGVLLGRGGDAPPFSTTAKVMILAGAAITGALVVVGLLLRDVVVRRTQQGQRVNPFLLAYFGQVNGCLMLILWSFSIIVATFIVTIATATL